MVRLGMDWLNRIIKVIQASLLILFPDEVIGKLDKEVDDGDGYIRKPYYLHDTRDAESPAIQEFELGRLI